MTLSRGQRQIPILCSRCMGPANPHDDGLIRCDYCHHADALPGDELGRALELKRRMAVAASSVAQLRGMESALSHLFESRGAFLRATGMWLVLVPLILGYTLVNSWGAIANAPGNLRAGMIVYILIGPMFVSGVGIAIAVALFIGRVSYRRRIRTHLFARAPREQGLPARCRVCDGELPDRRTAFVTCEYCTTQNLVTPELQENREWLLERETQFYRKRASQASAATTRGSLHMTRVFWISLVLVYVGTIGLAQLASSLLPN